jgi:hypothetical protein
MEKAAVFSISENKRGLAVKKFFPQFHFVIRAMLWFNGCDEIAAVQNQTPHA